MSASGRLIVSASAGASRTGTSSSRCTLLRRAAAAQSWDPTSSATLPQRQQRCRLSSSASRYPGPANLRRRTNGDESDANDYDAATRLADLLARAVVHSSGEVPYGSRAYRLVVATAGSAAATRASQRQPPTRVLATLRAHRNILFGAAVSLEGFDTNERLHVLESVGSPLVEAALQDAGSQGEQPQAVAALWGLSAWVRSSLAGLERDGNDDDDDDDDDDDADRCDSVVLRRLWGRQRDEPAPNESDRIALEAVRAMATGVPRRHAAAAGGAEDEAVPPRTEDPGHGSTDSSNNNHDAPDIMTTAYSAGTVRDGRNLWLQLAREFAPRSAEVRLYRRFGAEITNFDLALPCKDDEYLRSAGGAMARMFFL